MIINQPAYNDEIDNFFYAHSTERSDKSDWQHLQNHLVNVGELAEGFAETFKCAEYGKAAGLLHDLGKYTVEFQQRLEGKHPRIDHATWGAKIAFEKYDDFGFFIAYAIAGHHAGLANGDYRTDQKLTPLTERCNKTDLPILKLAWIDEIAQKLPRKLSVPPLKPKKGFVCFQQTFLSRMILSCLVDADRLDTEVFCNRVAGLPLASRGQYPSLAQLKTNFDKSLQSLKCDKDINLKRASILSAVRHNAKTLEPGLFSLTVPTGGGKTLASMAFALDHAETYQKRRIIYVIPFTSIIEQNAAVFREQFGKEYQDAIIEHHSAFNDPALESNVKQPDSKTKLKMAMENWDAPVIVTTVVQFMESLFSNRPSDCRKLHRIVNSVVILDEAQTLPMYLLRPCMAALDELAKNYGCSIVLCTATQPAFKEEDGFSGGLQNVRELAVSDSINPKQLYEQFQRVSVKHIGMLDDAQVIANLRDKQQVLCIVNNRKQAQELYQGIADLTGSFHLSTYMCAVHRKLLLAKIRLALKQGKTCRVVSTSLIEAGVDVDFPFVMRSDAGLDSIAQAAGRCNREGKRKTDESPVWIFTAKDHAPPPELKTYSDKMKETLSLHTFSSDPLGLEAIQDYFERVYWHKETGQTSELDKHNILGVIRDSKLQNLPFDWIAQKFKVISNTMKTVIVRYDQTAVDGIKQLYELPDYMSVGQIARTLQVYTISVPQHLAGELIKLRALQYVQSKRFGEQFLVLESDNLYTDTVGFNLEANPLIMNGEDCVW
ncbi:CRISPR-associated helicase Cas3' [Nitrosomonas ureae]|uniref:CRISPR-associated helicase, Cas3 family n=1 Tax=Nitrosomonas ureae TaxID=44577 RepID=A0A1H5U9Z6_9PROT|nr:CRISPR-associated helicase Cas3' [Nitrosomonas ureae]SEF71935.1 CRISPR-associated helicase, Cas3 family [Nitrosomonas ureae]